MWSGTSSSPRISTVRQARTAPLDPEIPTMMGRRRVTASALMRDLQRKSRRVLDLRCHDKLAARASLPLDRTRVADHTMRVDLRWKPYDEGATRAPTETRIPGEYFSLRIVANVLKFDRALANMKCRPNDLWHI
jgi:hypothetical protein